MQTKRKRFWAILLALTLLLSIVPVNALATTGSEGNPCLAVLDTAPATAETTAGGQYTLDLSTVFSDTASHSLTYTFESTVNNEHTKIQDGTFYFTVADAGSYEVTLKASCESGASASHKLAITVNEAGKGSDVQYGYDETDQASVTVYVTISNDGFPLQAADGTVLSHLKVQVPYFDLSLYGLEDYYRYGTNGGSGSYTGETVIKRPTGLHLYIYLLERYYMGLEESRCCKGTSGVLSYSENTDVLFMGGAPAFNSNGNSALTFSGASTSLYMTNFWGHDENLMYYRNHCYPYMSAGWGATSDYILLSDGDTWDVAMFSNWSFHNYGYFASFTQDDYTAEAGASVTAATQKWGTTSEATAFEAVNGLSVGLYDSSWKLVKTLSYDSETGNTLTFTAPEAAGTYYLMAQDPNAKDTESACIAPATAILTVNAKAECEACVDSDGDKLCDACGKNLNHVPVLVEGVEDTTVIIQTGQSYQLDDLMDGNIFTDPDGDTLTYANYFYRRSSDGGETWGERTGFQQMEFGGVNKSLVNNKAGIYLYEFVANDGYGDSVQTWTLTLDVRDGVPANVSFYVGRDQNYSANGNLYPVLELYKTAGIDENQFDYVGWFVNAAGKTEYVYNPADYTILDGETDYVEIDGVKYELHDYEKVVFTNSAFDGENETATASGTVVGDYNMFYATIETGRYSTRAYGWNTETQAYDIYLGGQSMPLPMEKDIYGGGGNDIYLRVVSCFTSTKKVDNTYFTADDYYAEMIMPVTGSMIHSGDPYVSSNFSGTYTYFPFMSYAAGNASLYNYYLYPYDTDTYIFNQAINQTTAAGYTVVTKSATMNVALKLTVHVPADAEFGLYFQYNNFNTKEMTPESSAVNEDGTKTLTYKVSKSNGNYTWRLTDPSGTYVTKAGWLASLSADTEKTFTFAEGDATDKKTHDTSGLGTTVSTRDEADIQVFLDHDGFMSTSGTYRVRAFRMWQLINSDTANIMVEPEFHVQVLQGNPGDVSPVNGGNAVGNWIDVTPSGTDIIAVNYDAIDMYSSADNAGTHGGLFPATAPERTGVFVITNEGEGTANANIRFNGGTESSRGSEWDYNYDTWYYLNTDTAPTLDFTVTGTGDVSVSYALVTTNSALQSSLSGWTSVSADEDGAFHADLLQFRSAGTKGGTVIIKMTDSTGTSYRLARVAEMTATVTNASNPGENFMPGDKVKIAFDGLYRAVNKVAGIFNPTTYYLRYSAGETEYNGSLAQYQQMDKATVTLTIPEDLELPEGEDATVCTFTNGYIFGSMYSASSPFDTLYHMTDTGVGTNFSAVGVSFVLSRLADIPVEVYEKVYYDVKLDIRDGDETLSGCTIVVTGPDGSEVTANENGIYVLGYGTYSYVITKSGYVCERGSFTLGSSSAEELIEGQWFCSVKMTKAAENAWDGTTVSEPTAIDGVYQIGTGAELAWFAKTVNGGSTAISGVLTADIDLAGYAWTPIGNNSKKFAGSFDGQNHKICNLYINYTGTTTSPLYQGLFGCVSGSSGAYAEIRNLTVHGSMTLTSTKNTTNAYSAGAVGYGQYINLTNVHSDVNIRVNRTTGNLQYVAGILGCGSYANITNCTNSGKINAWRYNGGIVGSVSNSSTITGCVNNGAITSFSTCAAGIVASLGNGCSVSACYNTGNIVSAGNYGAGIVGNCNNATVKNCFNTGAITCSFTNGSVIGTISNSSAVIANLYYLEGTAETGIGTVADETTQKAEAVSAETLASAEFVSAMNESLEEAAFVKGTDYPILAWQATETVTLGDLDGDGIVNSTDAAKLYRLINGGAEMTEDQCTAADVNGDGDVNSTDAAIIYRVANGLLSGFPTGNN